jgi:hypothetical protein
MIDDTHFLIRCLNQILLWKIDYVCWEVKLVSQADIAFEKCAIFIDELNDHRFLLYDDSSFIIGSVVGDKIVFGQLREFDISHLVLSKFSANKLIGFRSTDRLNDENVLLLPFCELDLENLTEEAIEIPLILSDGRRIPDGVSLLLLFLF